MNSFNTSDVVEAPHSHVRYVVPDFRINYYLSIMESFILTLMAELGDKTFIMLIILQLKANKATIYFASLSAQLLMNILSVFVGFAIDHLLYENLLDHIGMLFFITYGLFLLGAVFKSDEQSFESELLMVEKMDKNEEDWENEEKYKLLIDNENQKNNKIIDLKQNLDIIPEADSKDEITTNIKFTKNQSNNLSMSDNENNNIDLENKNDNGFLKKNNTQKTKGESIDFSIFSTIFCSMALSEFGDRTQMISMTMGALYNLTGVMIGSCFALVCSCTLGVYLGAKIIKYLKERYLNFVLACLFLFYGIQVLKSKRGGGFISSGFTKK